MSTQVAAVPTAAWLPEAHSQRGSGWRSLIGPVISLGVLMAALMQLRGVDATRAFALIPASPSFWMAFAGSYLLLPASEWLIYRRLWKLPASGLMPLLRKRISNELFLGYSGELYFYEWARRRTQLVTAPFGAIKDIAILSAQAGNVATLMLLMLAWPMLELLKLGVHGHEVLLSFIGIMLLSLPVMVLRRRLFSLPAAELRTITLIHFARIFGTLALSALVWHEVLPAVSLGWWVVLAALLQLISRLPLVPNKDIAFAGLAAYLVGPNDNLVGTVALYATLIVMTHIVLGSLLAVTELATWRGGR